MDTDSATEQLIKREKMRALRNGVRRGKNNYEDDLDELSQGLINASRGSKIADTLYDRLIPSLNNKSIISDFEDYIWEINSHT